MALCLTSEDKLSELHEAGFFISPAIMPYPFSVLANPDKSTQEFIATLIEYFNASTLKAMVKEWSHLPEWNARLHLFTEAVDNFSQERWASVIAVLIPQLEGTLRDAIFLLYGDESSMNAQQALRDLYRRLDDTSLPLGHLEKLMFCRRPSAKKKPHWRRQGRKKK